MDKKPGQPAPASATPPPPAYCGTCESGTDHAACANHYDRIDCDCLMRPAAPSSPAASATPTPASEGPLAHSWDRAVTSLNLRCLRCGLDMATLADKKMPSQCDCAPAAAPQPAEREGWLTKRLESPAFRDAFFRELTEELNEEQTARQAAESALAGEREAREAAEWDVEQHARDWRKLLLLIAEVCGEEDPESAVDDEFDPWHALRALSASRAEAAELRAELERMKREEIEDDEAERVILERDAKERDALRRGSDEWMKHLLGPDLWSRLWGPELEAFGRGVDALRAEAAELRRMLLAEFWLRAWDDLMVEWGRHNFPAWRRARDRRNAAEKRVAAARAALSSAADEVNDE